MRFYKFTELWLEDAQTTSFRTSMITIRIIVQFHNKLKLGIQGFNFLKVVVATLHLPYNTASDEMMRPLPDLERV